ncbi:CUB and sushi domain-containing protein 1a [Carassius carassius]|uniref:CUB and sushi domain-containing protein 1a n=1 Tax=Carassius carassius TaxID=217509 RepID=UPI0028692984|nr:CUB and sushi domain-containing protein 1a [Carassius carassius]
MDILILQTSGQELQSSSCGNPGVPAKGILNGTSFNVGDRIRYHCVAGYTLDGHAQLTCVTSTSNVAVWDFPIPICRAEDTCGGTFRGSSGTISSPDFQKDYQSSGECTWTILADPGDTISLVFTEFQMDSKLDSLEVEGSDPPMIW